MAKVVNIPGVGRVRFPDSMSAEEIAAEANRLHSEAVSPSNGTPRAAEGAQASSPLPFGAVQPGSVMIPGMPFDVRTLVTNLFGPLPDRNPEAFARETLPALGATVASAAFPPAAIARGLPLLSRLASVFPGIAAAGAGGAAGGAAGGLLDEERNVAEAAAEGGLRMAGAEGIGRAATGLGARILAPAVGLLDDTGRAALRFARGETIPGDRAPIVGGERRPSISPEQVAPGSLQKAVRESADFLIPARWITQPKRKRVVEKVLTIDPATRNEMFRKLIGADTRDVAFTGTRAVAERAARALGKRRASDLGFDRLGPRDFISRIFQSGDPAALRRRLGDEGFRDLLTSNLEATISRSTREVNGKRVIDGNALRAAWEAVPEKVRALYPEKTREAFESYIAFAMASQRLPELAAQGVVNLPSLAGTTAGVAVGIADTSGLSLLGGGVAMLTARALMSPTSLTNRWLTNEKLGPDIMRVAGRELTKLIPRHLLSEPSKEDEVSVSGGGGLLGP